MCARRRPGRPFGLAPSGSSTRRPQPASRADRHPMTGSGPFPVAPSRVVAGAGGVPIAVFSLGSGPPLVLVHGTTADHTAWRTVAPLLARSHTLHAIDRRGRGASGDGPATAAEGYALDPEDADVRAVGAAVVGEA